MRDAETLAPKDRYRAFRPIVTGGEFRELNRSRGPNDNLKFDHSKWPNKDNCYVYLISANATFHVDECAREWTPTGLVKVGISSNPVGRMAGFQTASPFKLRLEATWRMFNRADALWVEGRFHNRNRRYRTAGEWFRYDAIPACCAIDSTVAEWWIEHAVGDFGGSIEFLQFCGLSNDAAQLTLQACYGSLNPEIDEQLEAAQ